MSKLKFIMLLSLIYSISSSSFAEDTEVRIRNGRSYTRYLAAALEIGQFDIEDIFTELAPSLPQEGSSDEFYSTKDSIAKIAVHMCGIVNFMEGDALDINYIYESILLRVPTSEERGREIKNEDGSSNFLANCIVVALHPEVIVDQRGR